MISPDINRLDLNIMLILASENAMDEFKGMTINEINNYDEENPLSTRPNLSKRIRRLNSMGLIEKGIKDILSDTYYVTAKGLETIKWNGGKENE